MKLRGEAEDVSARQAGGFISGAVAGAEGRIITAAVRVLVHSLAFRFVQRDRKQIRIAGGIHFLLYFGDEGDPAPWRKKEVVHVKPPSLRIVRDIQEAVDGGLHGGIGTIGKNQVDLMC